ncbi:CE1759 family FMN reductase [Mycolicibacter arupensis]|jgi:FMN reductase|uniref:NADPH-dependent FMN reductase n=1 Tax=Mycolicibacter arupensis TaxID=342002 RepID=A0A0F5N1V3_9MYCO|nr:CE1759 family FMN reductase [Mycolicibacter arupensis]KKC00233.1 NADPH-dependent FMN reductase [Mycolicibacter arupensis]MCV7277958.1 NAD(P)H-dependent oxidoreductase [Mycolicibacter arupensis]OQZ99931.1 NADPH-dependent FMN reductase [Mycolicibacter arupensis]TXI60212.1 MAG: NADPH-dependent FMN reductase [Mycolicibacter arupensis]
MRVVAISGGLREPSTTRLLVDRLATAVGAELGEADVEVIELRRLARAITDALVTGFASPELAEVFDAIAGSDGVIAVTPTFNATFSGLFKSFFDVLPEQTLDGLPVLIAATGGTERHSLVLDHALRPMFSYLHALVSPTGVYAATSDFGADRSGAALSERIASAARDFARLVRVSGPRPHPDQFADELTEIQGLLTGTR